MQPRRSLPFALAASLSFAVLIAAGMAQPPAPAAKDRTPGYDDTPILPGQPYRVHDVKRPHPRVIAPGPKPGAPPSDAIVPFDG